MGAITSRIWLPIFRPKNLDAYRRELEDINKEIAKLEENRLKLRHQHSMVLELITTYSRLLYILVAIVFFFSTLPSSLLEYILFCGPLLIFHLLVCALRIAVKWYYEHEVARNVDRVRKIKFKKKEILSKVVETTQFKEAKEMLEKYGPEKKTSKLIRRLPNQQNNQYLDNIVTYVLGEKKKNSLICIYCKWHNGMALEEEYEQTAFRCCHCFRMNHAQKFQCTKREKPNATPSITNYPENQKTQ